MTFDLDVLELAPQEFETCAVRLALPSLDPTEVRFDPRKPPTAPLKLACPECGSVRIEVPGIGNGTVRVRAFDASDTGGGIWNDSAPNRFKIVDGVALVPWVPLGIELAYEAKWEGQAVPLTGHFFGPRRIGEEMRFAPPTLASFPLLRGRLLDDEGRPIAEKKVDVNVCVATKGSASSSGTSVTTDAGGRFELPLVDEVPKGGRREITFSVEVAAAAVAPAAVPAAASAVVKADALVELAKPLPAGPHDVGDVILVEPGSLRWLARLSD
ncbi:MAG: carboxypeptidase regulatory-like domain-containing protein [Planctomycetes bacterium]|nr:carboxypeptidase regulatory-like domain-containing protein [Planctomycetota bacterium]